jgi:DNA-directed RNA polymerase subunit RPC12/RpoP
VTVLLAWGDGAVVSGVFYRPLMGNHFQTVVDLDATQADASALAARGLGWLVAEGIVSAERTDCVLGAPLGHPPGPLWTKAVDHQDWEPGDGLNIETGRTVFHGGQGDAGYAVCPHCAGRVDLYTDAWDLIESAWEPFGKAMDVWQDTGLAAVACPRCGRSGDLTRWAWDYDYYAFGYLGFEFWDWPEFSPGFLDRFSHALGGHRTVVVRGKL